MLKSIDPLLTGELLAVLDAMGHGDDLLIADRNFPAAATAMNCTSGQLILCKGVDTTQLAQAIFSVFPIDSFVEVPIHYMEIDGRAGFIGETHAEFLAIARKIEGRNVLMESIERQKFYQVAKNAFAVIQCGETRPYANFIIKKGIVPV